MCSRACTTTKALTSHIYMESLITTYLFYDKIPTKENGEKDLGCVLSEEDTDCIHLHKAQANSNFIYFTEHITPHPTGHIKLTATFLPCVSDVKSVRVISCTCFGAAQ